MLVKSKAELIKKLDEVIVLAEQLNAAWDTIGKFLEEQSVCCNTQVSMGASTLL